MRTLLVVAAAVAALAACGGGDDSATASTAAVRTSPETGSGPTSAPSTTQPPTTTTTRAVTREQSDAFLAALDELPFSLVGDNPNTVLTAGIAMCQSRDAGLSRDEVLDDAERSG